MHKGLFAFVGRCLGMAFGLPTPPSDSETCPSRRTNITVCLSLQWWAPISWNVSEMPFQHRDFQSEVNLKELKTTTMPSCNLSPSFLSIICTPISPSNLIVPPFLSHGRSRSPCKAKRLIYKTQRYRTHFWSGIDKGHINPGGPLAWAISSLSRRAIIGEGDTRRGRKVSRTGSGSAHAPPEAPPASAGSDVALALADAKPSSLIGLKEGSSQLATLRLEGWLEEQSLLLVLGWRPKWPEVPSDGDSVCRRWSLRSVERSVVGLFSERPMCLFCR